MAGKEFRYRGRAMQELLDMPLNEFAKLLGARARRSVMHGINNRTHSKMMKKIETAARKRRAGETVKPIKTHDRDMVVLPQMVGLQFSVHKGNEFKIMDVVEDMMGHYLGEFALTRKKLSHGRAGIGATKSSTAITARG